MYIKGTNSLSLGGTPKKYLTEYRMIRDPKNSNRKRVRTRGSRNHHSKISSKDRSKARFAFLLLCCMRTCMRTKPLLSENEPEPEPEPERHIAFFFSSCDPYLIICTFAFPASPYGICPRGPQTPPVPSALMAASMRERWSMNFWASWKFRSTAALRRS